MVSIPVAASRLTSSILVSTGMLVFSFCRPSRGPTSTMRTWSLATYARGEMEKVRRPAGRRWCARRWRMRDVMVGSWQRESEYVRVRARGTYIGPRLRGVGGSTAAAQATINKYCRRHAGRARAACRRLERFSHFTLVAQQKDDEGHAATRQPPRISPPGKHISPSTYQAHSYSKPLSLDTT
jgi:hypothetical protein